MDEASRTEVERLAAAGETLTCEFKGESRAPLDDGDLVEAVVCLANGAGGDLLVGVEDDGSITGARPRHGPTTDPARVQALVANRTQPSVSATVTVLSVDDRAVVRVSVPDSPVPIGTSAGTYKRRALGSDGRPTCVPFHAHEMLAREIERGRTDYAALPVPGASWDDLDPLELARLRRLVAEAGGRADPVLAELSDIDLARALGVVQGTADAPVVLTGALLLFGRTAALRRHVPTHEVAFQVFGSSLDLLVNDFTRAPLLRTAEDLIGRFRARNEEQEIQLGLIRVGVPAWSETAFRELLANALTHRDWTQRAAVHVRWDAESLEVSSPGGLPPGVTVRTLLVAAPRPRSPLLSDAFKRAGLVERSGRGINRAFGEQLRVGRRAPDYGRTTDETVVAVLPGGPANLALTRWVVEQEQEQRPLSLAELQAIGELLEERRLTTAHLAGVLQRSEAETRTVLLRLVERGVVEARGEGRGRTWHLSAAAYRQLHTPAAYVRVRGFEPVQQEQMVLSYVAAHGSITRAQAATLCAISPEQAGVLLRRLRDRGDLVSRGRGRGASYAAP